MSDYTHLNLKDDVDDQAPNFGLSPDLEFRMARVPLEMENAGVSYLRIAPFIARSSVVLTIVSALDPVPPSRRWLRSSARSS